MLHYQVASKLCLNQLQWDPVRPSSRRGPSRTDGERRVAAEMRGGYDRAGFWWGEVGAWLEFVLISGVWGRMRVWR